MNLVWTKWYNSRFELKYAKQVRKCIVDRREASSIWNREREVAI